jgi:hypothetical protein
LATVRRPTTSLRKALLDVVKQCQGIGWRHRDTYALDAKEPIGSAMMRVVDGKRAPRSRARWFPWPKVESVSVRRGVPDVAKKFELGRVTTMS